MLGVALGTSLAPEGTLSLNVKIWLADDSVSNARNKSDVTSFNKRVALSVLLAIDFFLCRIFQLNLNETNHRLFYGYYTDENDT